MKNVYEKYFELVEFKRIYPMPKFLKFMQIPLYNLQIPLLNHAYMLVLKKK